MSKNDAHVDVRSDDGNNDRESSNLCPDESSDEGNTREKKASSTKQKPKAWSPSVMRILHETSTQHARENYPRTTNDYRKKPARHYLWSKAYMGDILSYFITSCFNSFCFSTQYKSTRWLGRCFVYPDRKIKRGQ